MNQNNTTIKEGYVIRDQTLPHFITATVVDWIDVFSRKTYRDTVVECLEYCISHKAMVLYGYVIMSNHIHLIIQSSDGKLIIEFNTRFQKIYSQQNLRKDTNRTRKPKRMDTGTF